MLILRYLEDCAEIDTFLMSCRVMGRNVEVEIMARLKGMLREKGIKVVKATYIKTAKNSPVEDLFEKLGFEVVLNKKTEKRYMARIDDLPMVTSTFKDVTEEWS